MGDLCWHRQELALVMTYNSLSDADMSKLVADYARVLDSAEVSVRADIPALPSGVGAFAERFLVDVARAQAVLASSGSDPKTVQAEVPYLFDYDSYPATDEYVSAAKEFCVGL